MKLVSLDEMGISIALSTKKSTSRPLLRGAELEADTNPFKPIGIGKPLVIRFHSIYLGDLKKGLFNSNQDILVTSAIKDDVTFDAAPRAIHQIYRRKDERETLSPSSLNEGTPLIYYSKAFDSELLRITVEIKADRFPAKAFDTVANSLTAAGGIPIFGALSSYLIAGGQIIKSASSILNTLLEGGPILSYKFDILDGVAGLKNTKAGFILGLNTNDKAHFKDSGYEITDLFDDNQLVLAKDGKKYNGSKPYIIMSIDGSEKTQFESFKPTIASAALLKKFYGIKENSSVDEMMDILQVYNDFKYVRKIKDLSKDLIGASEEKKKELNELIEAYKKNIKNSDDYSLE